jgi:hypothetical protein
LIRALALALAFLSAACQSSPPTPAAPRAVAPQPDLLAEARAAMERGEYERAAGLLRDVVATRPTSLEAHFRLGVSASYVDALEAEAVREFEWVVAHAPADSPEARIAREWLHPAAGTPAPTPPAEPNPERASLSGVAMGGDGVARPLVRHKISLKGMKEPVLETAFDVRTDQEGRFTFRDVPPGEYMLTDSLSGQTRWRLRLTLKRGERVTFDLTPDNGTATRDDFPDTR